ncbi:cupin [Alishewanella longhuensis]|uniref:Cupin n=1 Tax=Alishewanella longhuensis TaxID=1091037 RepID=A0ABQ3KV84_9ALTE|nr:cupin-like domain-containing protein [Alishewanella longhuensis]GHG62828.1 cupin [Alishewanella longhuensis]
MRSIPEVNHISPEYFQQELLPKAEPVVIKAALQHWPLFQQAQKGDENLSRYLRQLDSGTEFDTLLLAPETDGQIFYATQGVGFNFERRRYPVSIVAQQLLRTKAQPTAVRIALQSALIEQALPGFTAAHPLALLPAASTGRLWLGNQVQVPAHFDDGHNLACVIAGRRRFTLFPPAQVANLYPGPVDYAPTGTPISLVNFAKPDLQRHPRFEDALAAAWQAELAPGDLLYIPLLWWHQVASLDSMNMLVNFWWGGSLAPQAVAPAPFDSVLHSLLSLRQYTASERAAWGALFNYFVFDQPANAAVHIPEKMPALQRKTGTLEKEQLVKIRQWLSSQLSE